jgi:hypothetical protein
MGNVLIARDGPPRAASTLPMPPNRAVRTGGVRYADGTVWAAHVETFTAIDVHI